MSILKTEIRPGFVRIAGQKRETMRRLEDFTQKLELQDRVRSDWCQYFCNQPQVEFDSSANHDLLSSGLKVSCVQLEGHADSNCSIWTDSEPARANDCKGRSFVMDARIRLESLKSSCSSPRCTVDTSYRNNCEKDLRDAEESEHKQSALDLVEILDIEDDEQDEESW